MTSMDPEREGTKGLRARLRPWAPALLLGPLALVVLILLVGVILGRSQPPPPTAAPPVPVEVLTISPIASLEETFDLPGVVEPNRVVRVSAEIASRVERIEGAEGQPCKQGQVIIALNTDLLAAAYHQVKATAEFDARGAGARP